MASPLSYVVESSKNLVSVTYHEQPSFNEWTETIEEIFDDPRYQPHFGILLDRRAMTHAADTDYIRRMVSFIDRRWKSTGGGRWAILSEDGTSFGMGRMAEQLSDATDCIRSFRQVAEAEIWLAGGETNGRPAPTDAPLKAKS